MAMLTAERPLVQLAPMSEPTELLASLRSLAADKPASARAEAPALLAEAAAAEWGLSSHALPAQVVVETFQASKREIWLWVKGDRRWSQLSDYLSARVARRLGEA